MARYERPNACSYQRLDLLWKKYFRDPSLCYQHQSTKIDEWHSPSWVREEFQRRVNVHKDLKDDHEKENNYENYLFSFVPLLQSCAKGKDLNEAVRLHEKENSYENHLFSFVPLLQACAKGKDLDEGIRVHADILERGVLLQNSPHIVSSLINMYAKCGAFAKAQQLLEGLCTQNIVCWNALITGYAEHGKVHEVLNCYESMLSNNISPDVVTFICIVKACGSAGALEMGIQIHLHIVRKGLLQKTVTLGNVLIGMYAKCGMLAKAQEVLEDLLVRNVVSWSALIAGYAQQGQGHEAFYCFNRMKLETLFPNIVTFICILKACSGIGAIDKGKEIHEEIMSRGLIEKDVVLGNALVDMYAKCGMLAKSQRVLEELPIRNIVSWNALISGYAQQGECHGTLSSFEHMQNEGLSPDAVTFTCILKACSSAGDIDIGKRIHDEIARRGLLEKDIVLGTALVDMYAACNVLGKAKHVLEHLPFRNAASWSALISGYTQQGQGHEALNCYEKMQNEGLSPDVVTFICMLKACGSTGAIDKGKQIHEEILRKGLMEKDIALGNALLDMYIKCGMLEKAQNVFEELPFHDVVSWSTLIFGYVQEDQGHEALNCLHRMQSECLSPDVVTFICMLKACGSIGAVSKGKQIHEEISSKCILQENIVLGTTLVDMYAKGGMLEKAKDVLDELRIRDIVSWNALIVGYAQQGQAHEALNCFEQMQNEGLSPDEVTFVCVLSACSHSGLLVEAQMLLGNMARKYSISPSIEHQSCMLIFLGCAGQFDEVTSVIKVMASCQYPELWLVVLGACRKWGNVKLGKLVFYQIVQLDDSCAAAYVLMESIFAAAGMIEDANKVKDMRLNYATWKKQKSGKFIS